MSQATTRCALLRRCVVPTIGITASTEREARLYLESVEKRGATARLFLPQEHSSANPILAGIDALMVTSGEDIDPHLYHEDPDPAAGLQLKAERDQMELPLLQTALGQDMPILAICRGMQALNVVMGGKLIQDIPNHRMVRRDERWVPSTHRIFVTPGSKLAAIIGIGGFVRVNSIHHQGVKEPQKAPSLMASAYSVEDSLIEGLESPTHSWVIGVQCHPERESEVPPNWGLLFDGLIEWAETFAAAQSEVK